MTRPFARWHRLAAVLGILGAIAAPFALQAQAQAPSPISVADQEGREEDQVFKAVLKETCGRRIVLLGENGFHGEGKTIAFKARLVEQLVSRCGFRIVLFEASHYEFLDIERRAKRGEVIGQEQVSAAIGQIWNQDQEMEGLISFLVAERNRGRFIVGGLDDQLGTRGLLFGNDAMIAELASLLPEPMQQSCGDRLKRRTYSAYSKEEPYSAGIRDVLQACVSSMRQTIAHQTQNRNTPYLLAMLDNIERYLLRDFQPDTRRMAGRDASMYLNFRWWLAHRGQLGPKVLVWAANSHIAKGTGVDPQYEGGAPLGNLIAADFGRKAFSVGFSANSGNYRWSRSENKAVPFQADSLENRAITTSGQAAVLVTGKAFNKEPEVSGLLNHLFQSAEWWKFFDAVVVFKAERPPVRPNK
jgi:erythromycin esterase-like protein